MRGRVREGQPLSGLRCQVVEVLRAGGKPPARAKTMMAGFNPEVTKAGAEKSL